MEWYTLYLVIGAILALALLGFDLATSCVPNTAKDIAFYIGLGLLWLPVALLVFYMIGVAIKQARTVAD